jgi:hypothetical protein
MNCCVVGVGGNAICLRAYLLYIHRYLCAQYHKECYLKKRIRAYRTRNFFQQSCAYISTLYVECLSQQLRCFGLFMAFKYRKNCTIYIYTLL